MSPIEGVPDIRRLPRLGKIRLGIKPQCQRVMNLLFVLPTVPGLGVWQLDYSPATEALESKSKPPSRFLNGILPSSMPQKAAEIGQLIQSLWSNPTGAHLINCQVRTFG